MKRLSSSSGGPGRRWLQVASYPSAAAAYRRRTIRAMADDPVDALYALPPGDFTAARNDLVRRLRTAGERERAKQVAGLRRPTVAAWAVNQAVRSDPDAYAALLAAGQELRRAQRRALSGMASSGLRDASRARREVIERLVGTAAGLLADAGGDPATHREDMAATFEAASASDEAAEQVGAARLARPLAPPSTFDDLAALSVVPEPAEDEVPEPAEDEAPDAARDGAATEEEAAERRRAADAVAAVRHRAEEAAAARSRAHEEADAAREQADAAGAEADEAAARAEEAAAEAERARREADRLARRAEAARDTARRSGDDAVDADRAAQALARELENAEERLRSLPG